MTHEFETQRGARNEVLKGLVLMAVVCLVMMLSGGEWPSSHVHRPSSNYNNNNVLPRKDAAAAAIGALSSLFLAAASRSRNSLYKTAEGQQQRKLFHIPATRSLYLPTFFNIVDWENDHSNGSTSKTIKDDDINCTTTSTAPSFQVCLYANHEDIYISAALASQGIWEPYITRVYQEALRHFPKAAVIDIGANIGFFTLLAATMGHRVVAIEPNAESVRRLNKGVILNGMQDKVVLLQNALSSLHRNVSLSVNSNNQGGVFVLEDDNQGVPQDIQTVTMDDLLSLMPSDTAIIKIDIEGYECRGMAASARLLDTVHIPYLLMEWQQMYKHRYQPTSACPMDLMRQMTDYLVRLGYVAHEVRTGIQLNPQRSTTAWQVGDIYWRLHDQPLLVPPL